LRREVDIGDAEALANVFVENEYAAVIHFAGLKMAERRYSPQKLKQRSRDSKRPPAGSFAGARRGLTFYD